jgi:methyl-accepting chemotaxis protein
MPRQPKTRKRQDDVSRQSDIQGQIDAINRSQCVIDFDLDGTIRSANRNFLDLMGYELAEIVGQHHRIFAPAEYADSDAYQEFWTSLRQGQFIATEFKRIGKNNREVWIQASYNPVLDPSGKPYKVVKFATDITDRKMMEAMVASQAVVEFDLQGHVLTANDKFLSVMGYPLDEIVGKHHSIFVDAGYAGSAEYTEFWDALRRGDPQIVKGKRLNRRGEVVWLQASYTPFFDRDGQPYKVVKFATDITDLVHAEEELKEHQQAMMEMSTPVAEIWDDMLLLPIVGFVDSTRADEIMRATLQGIAKTRARVFILDISGVAVVDTAVANHLIKVATATRLMGCQCLISGLSPAISQTIVDLGIDTGDITTTATLRDALAFGFKALKPASAR